MELIFITAEADSAAEFAIKVKLPVVLQEIFVKVFPLISRVRVGAKFDIKIITPEAATVCVVVLKSLLVIETDDEGVVEVCVTVIPTIDIVPKPLRKEILFLLITVEKVPDVSKKNPSILIPRKEAPTVVPPFELMMVLFEILMLTVYCT